MHKWKSLLSLFMTSAAIMAYEGNSNLPEKNKIEDEPKTTPEMTVMPASFVSAAPKTEPLVTIEDTTEKPAPLVSMHSPLLKGAYKLCDKNKYAAIVMDAVTGEILYGRNEHSKRHPASIAKLMTMFIAFEEIERGRLSLGDTLEVTHLRKMPGIANLNVSPNQGFTVEKALGPGIAGRSAMDACEILAEAISGSSKKFVERMNKTALSLGMKRTHFKNTSGVPDPEQIMSAADAAILMKALPEYFPELCDQILTPRHFAYINADRSVRMDIDNHALRGIPGADMGKTGLINMSGFNTVLSFPGNHRRLIVSVFGGNSSAARNQHARDLYAMVSKQYDAPQTPLHENTMDYGKLRNLPLKRDIRELEDFGEAPPVLIQTQWDQNVDPLTRMVSVAPFSMVKDAPKPY